MQDCEFKVFAGPAARSDGRVAALQRARGGEPPAQGDRRLHRVRRRATARRGSRTSRSTSARKGREGLQSPILKFLSDAAIDGILERTGAVDGDLVFFGADTAKVVNDALGALRLKLGHDLRPHGADGWQPLWVVDFPMFEWDADAKRWVRRCITRSRAAHPGQDAVR